MRNIRPRLERHRALVVLLIAAAAACSSSDASTDPTTAPADPAAPVVVAAAPTDTTDPPTAPTAPKAPAAPIVAARSLAITSGSVLQPCLQAPGLSSCGPGDESTFSLRRVLAAILATGGVASDDVAANDLARRIWDTDNGAARASFSDGSHCDAEQDASGLPTLNGFPIQCNRNEGVMAASGVDLLGSTSASYFYPIAIVSRMDLRDRTNATTCGEFRLLYGRRDANAAAPGGRALLNFEAMLPNPRPELGEAGCTPIAAMWAGFSDASATADSVRAALATFYFEGTELTYADAKKVKSMPVVHFDNYGGKRGQVRTNEFMNGAQTPRWLQRELSASKIGTTIQLAPVYVKSNPWPGLFAQATGSDTFSTWFVEQVPSLLVTDVNALKLADDARWGAGQSDAETGPTGADVVGPTGDPTKYANDYARFASPALTAAVQAKLTSLGSALTPANVLDRATAASCGGCHHHANDDSLGGGLAFPSALGFTHVDETAQVALPTDAFGGTGSSFAISPALEKVFLPARATDLATLISH